MRLRYRDPVPLHRRVNISEDRVRYIAEVPIKDETTEAWVAGNAAYLAALTKPAGQA